MNKQMSFANNTAVVAQTRRGLLAAFLAPSIAVAGTASIIEHIPGTAGHFFKSGRYLRLAPLSTRTVQDLAHAPKADNIADLLQLAFVQRRMDSLDGQIAWKIFNDLPSGDKLLLKCLQVETCQPIRFSEIARASGLHAEVLLRRPDLNLIQANHAVGAISEQVMKAYFENSGWIRIEGEIGRTGIDGLFVKRKADGVIREVLLVESKYNTSTLSPTNHGQQMSRDWALRKLEELRLKHPNNSDYEQSERFIERGFYRARLWTMRFNNGEIEIDLQRVHSKGADISLLDDPGNRIAPPPPVIHVSHPVNDLERTLVRAYNNALDEVGPPAH